jgi:hypothetical protein
MPTSDITTQQGSEYKTLLDILLADKLITQGQYDDIKVKSASQGISSENILESMGVVNEKKLAEERAKLLGVPFISLDSTSFAPQAISLIPKAVVERFSLIPFMYDEASKTLSVAMSNPVDLEALQFVGQKTGLRQSASNIVRKSSEKLVRH